LFREDFNATCIELRENFRSSKAVIAAAQALSPDYEATQIFPIEGEVQVYKCADEQSEADLVADMIERLVSEGHEDVEGGISRECCAVLGRNKFVFSPIIEVFEKRGIEFYKKISAANVESGSELVTEFELTLRILAN